MSQESASEAFERTYLAGLEAADKNFVLDPDVPWPTLRTKANPMAEPAAPSKKRRKGVRSNDQTRNHYIILAFALIHCGGNKQSVLADDEQRARLYDDGRYAWIQDTSAVLTALRSHYSNAGSRRQAFMAFQQLCEALQYIETRDIYGDAIEHPDAEEMNPAHEERDAPQPTSAPEAPSDTDGEQSDDPDYYEHILDGLAYPDPPIEQEEEVETDTVTLSPARMIQQEMHSMQSQLYSGLTALVFYIATLFRITGSTEEASPPELEEITVTDEATDVLDNEPGLQQAHSDNKPHTSPYPASQLRNLDVRALDTRMERLSIADTSTRPDAPTDPTPQRDDDAASVASTLTLPGSDEESSESNTEPSRRTQETYQRFLREYQDYIEKLRLRAMAHLESANLDVSQWRKKKNQAIHAVMAYLCLATLYGDVDGSLEPVRLDWYTAKFVESLPETSADRCMYVLVTADRVTLHLRGGNKNYCTLPPVDISRQSPKLAEVLRLWMPHAQSAQPQEQEPHVIIMHSEQKSYGTPFIGKDYGKLLKRTWTGPAAREFAAPDPQADATGEENPKDRHGYGCDWARKVVSRARRGVIYADDAARSRSGAAGQGHSDETERQQYRTVGV
eukprot:SAG11_NODE_609_length_8224_cov_5.446154_5_plen_619_part_00